MKRNTILAILITFCFTASIFMVIPIESAVNPYDPLLDYNHDGKINLQDLTKLALSYNTAGDPTENVTVTDSYEEMNFNPVVNGVGSYVFEANTAGYRQVTFTLLAVVPDGDNTVPYNVYVAFNEGNTLSYSEIDFFRGVADTLHDINFNNENFPWLYNCTSRTYPVTGTQFWIEVDIQISPTPPVTFYVSIFATA